MSIHFNKPHTTKRGACPRCQGRGADTHGDNLQWYSDNSAHCFACQFHIYPPAMTAIEELSKKVPSNEELDGLVSQLEANLPVKLPDDVSTELSIEALRWLDKYGITRRETIDHDFLWSDFRKALFFPLFGYDKRLMAWQSRSFNLLAQNKYYSQGPIHDQVKLVIPRTGKHVSIESDGIVVVEDLISAIKIGRQHTAMPLFGCALARPAILRLNYMTKHVTLWLDQDKYGRAMFFAKQLELLNVKTKVIYTAEDPKAYSDEEIAQFLSG